MRAKHCTFPYSFPVWYFLFRFHKNHVKIWFWHQPALPSSLHHSAGSSMGRYTEPAALKCKINKYMWCHSVYTAKPSITININMFVLFWLKTHYRFFYLFRSCVYIHTWNIFVPESEQAPRVCSLLSPQLGTPSKNKKNKKILFMSYDLDDTQRWQESKLIMVRRSSGTRELHDA